MTLPRPPAFVREVFKEVVEVPQSRRWSTPVVLLVRWHRSLWARRIFAGGSGAALIVLVLLAVRHFETTSWPLSSGHPALLVTAGLLFLLAQALKAYGWGRLFAPNERPKPLALAAANGGAALIGVVLPGRFDDAMRVAVVRRYPGCPAGVRALCLSLVMLGLIDSAALAPLARARGRGCRRARSHRVDRGDAAPGSKQACTALPGSAAG